MAATRILYRCKRHRYTTRRTFDLRSQNVGTWQRPVRIVEWYDLTTGGLIETGAYGVPTVACPSCPPNPYGLRGEPVRGRLVEGVKCGALCRNAVGPNCDCSCGGDSHGAGYADTTPSTED